MPPRPALPPRHLALTASLSAVLLLAACAGEPQPLWGPEAAQQAIPLHTTAELVTVSATSPAPAVREQLRQALARVGDPARAHVTLLGPAGATAEQVGRQLRALGVASAHLETVARPAADGSLLVLLQSFQAGLPPCSASAPEPLLDQRYLGQMPFGCANAVALARMVADPADLNGGTLGPADASLQARAVRRYRDGKLAPLESSSPGTAGTSGGGSSSSAQNSGLSSLFGGLLGASSPTP